MASIIPLSPVTGHEAVRRLGICCGGLAGLIAAGVLAGWWWDNELLRTTLPGFGPMGPTTALSLVLSAASLILLWNPEVPAGRRWGARVCAGIALTLSALTLVEHACGLDLGLNGLFGATAMIRGLTLLPAWGAMLAAGALLLLAHRHRPIRSWHQWLTVAVIALAMLPTLARLFSVADARVLRGAINMSFNATLGLQLLAVALLAARPGEGVMRRLLADDATGLLSRRMVISVLVVFPLLAWLDLLLGRVDGWPVELSMAVLVVVAMLLLLGLTVVIARSLRDMDFRRAQAEQEKERAFARLLQQAATLQEQVAVRTRELAEAALRAERLALVARHIPSAVIITDGNERIEWVNDAFPAMTGYTLAEVQGRNTGSILLGPGTDQAVAAEMARRVRAGLNFKGDLLCHTKDGRGLWLRFEVEPVRDARGAMQHLIAILTDLTEEKNAAEALRLSEERWQLALNGSDDGVWDWDLKAGTYWFSPRYKALLGYADAEFANTDDTWRQAVHPDDRPWLQASLDAYLARQTETYAAEFRMQHRDGSWRWILSRGKAHFSAEGRPLRMIGTHTDVTSWRETEAALRGARLESEQLNEQLEAAIASAQQSALEANLGSQAKSEFLAVMSHEIRTPMNAVIGFTSLLLDTPLTTEQRDWLRTVRGSGEALLTIINDILDFSKIESGKLELERQPVELRECLGETVDLLGETARAKNLQLLLEVAPEVPEFIETDGTRVRQVLLNLIGNAIKFTAQGTVQVRVAPESGPAGEALIGFSVCDTGTGIPADRLDRLFKPFSQVDSSTTRKYGGTGLGLAICKSLVKLLGGAIGVKETSPAGSTFHFTIAALPCALEEVKAKPALPPPVSTSHSVPAFPLGSQAPVANPLALHVLVAEDNAVNRKLIQHLLLRLGYSADFVSNGRECLEALKQNTYDVVLMDCQMPEMDGYAATQSIRAGEAGESHRTIKIVALTAHAMAGDREKCLECGMDEYLTKPIQPAQLLATLKRVSPSVRA